MTPAEFAAAWGADKRVRASPAAVSSAGLSPASSAFLCDVGLPSSAEPGFAFSFPAGQVPLLAELPSPPRGMAREQLQRFRRIGGSAWMHVCIDMEEGERVIQVIENKESVVRFLNSSLGQLAECLVAFRDVMSEALAQEAEATRAAIAAAVHDSSLTAAERSKRFDRPLGDPKALKQAAEAENAEALKRLLALKQQIGRIDAAALAVNACWRETIESRITLGGLSG